MNFKEKLNKLKEDNGLVDVVLKGDFYNESCYETVSIFEYNNRKYKVKSPLWYGVKEGRIYTTRVNFNNPYKIALVIFNHEITESDIKAIEEKLQITF